MGDSVGSSFEDAVLTGGAFMAGSSQQTIALGSNLRMVLANPAGSGKTAFVNELQLFAATLSFVPLILNPTQAPATSAIATNLLVGSSIAPVCTLKYDTSTTALSGTPTSIVLAAPAQATAMFNTPIPRLVLPPGTAIGINVPVTVAGVAIAGIIWCER